MPRYYAKNVEKIDYVAVLEGIRQILVHNNSIRPVAKSCKLAPASLARYVTKVKAANIDVSIATDEVIMGFIKLIAGPRAKTIFSREQEQMLMKYVLKASDVYYGLSISELKALAFQFAKFIQCSYPESWNKNREASKDWYYSFMRRNPQLSLRTPEQISQNRAKAFCKENLDAFFENFRSVLDATTFEVHSFPICSFPVVKLEPQDLKSVEESSSEFCVKEESYDIKIELESDEEDEQVPPKRMRESCAPAASKRTSHGDRPDDNNTYVPKTEPVSRRLFQGEVHDGSPERAPATTPSPNESSRRNQKQRKKVGEWARVRASRQRNLGLEYVDRKGHLHQRKEIMPVGEHNCRFNCNKISEDVRQQFFEDYWALGSWNQQTSFLFSCIKTREPVRKRVTCTREKLLSAEYFLLHYRVCKVFIIKTLNISAKRLNNMVKKQFNSEKCISPKDKRGLKEPKNKISQAKTDYVKRHIASFPKYSSHYSRKDNPNKRYLSANLNLKMMYKLYEEKCFEDGDEPVKEHHYRFIFKNKFNLSFDRPRTDTCCTCDKLELTINSGTDDASRLKAVQEKDVHLRHAEGPRDAKKRDIEKAKTDSSICVFTFDLQKTLPTPMLTCGDVYYARQLWTYNLGVHDLCSNKAVMHMWHEGQGCRGNEEIASCILKYLTEEASSAKHIIAYSDNCHKSHKFVKFWLYVVKHLPNVQTVDHKFFVPGHSYTECDRDFRAIDKIKRKKEHVYIPSQWMEIVSNASKNFSVKEMDRFLDIDVLAESFSGEVPSMRKINWLHFEKTSGDKVFYKTSLEEDMPFSIVELKSSTDLVLHVTAGKRAIKQAKYDDLAKLMKFVPPIYHSFYSSLSVQQKKGKPAKKMRKDDKKNEEDELDDEVLENIYDTDDE